MSDSSDGRPFPDAGRLLGIDYGTKRLGFAVSNAEQTIASPIENYTRQSPEVDARKLKQNVADYGVQGIVIGLPVHMSGDEGGKAGEARAFGRWVEKTTQLPIRYWDERYTSSIAEMHLLSAELSKKQRKARLDKLAAQIMLQTYLDAPDRTARPGAM